VGVGRTAWHAKQAAEDSVHREKPQDKVFYDEKMKRKGNKTYIHILFHYA